MRIHWKASGVNDRYEVEIDLQSFFEIRKAEATGDISNLAL
jgi:hypothetical protein